METKIVISGSYRKHLKEIGIASSKFIDAGVEVLAPLTHEVTNEGEDFLVLTTDDPQKTADVLEKDFMSKSKTANFQYVVDVDGYIGKSTAAEMCFSILNNIPIVMAEEIIKFSTDVPISLGNILRNSTFSCLPIHMIDSSSIDRLDLSKFTPNTLSSKQKEDLNLFVDDLLEELKHVKI